MAGSIKAATNKVFHDGKTAIADITAQHKGHTAPKFGGEFEVFLLHQDENNILTPLGYDNSPCGQTGTGAIIERFMKDQNYAPLKQIEGKTILLEGTDGSIISFEKYASILERADRAYNAENGLNEFAASIENFATSIENLCAEFNMKASPFDYDVFCVKEDFTEDKQAPSERFGEGGMLLHYDTDHPLVDAIDRHTTSGHFSVGYEDREHLWRMTQALTKLTPALYAAFAGSPPTYLTQTNDHKELLSVRDLQALEESGNTPDTVQPVLVPRALAWSLADESRTGLPDELIDLSFSKDGSFHDYITMMCSKADIIHTAYNEEKSFLQTLSERASGDIATSLTLNDYIAHIGTVWHDFRADTVRLESRMPGNAVWKSKATAALLVGALQNKEGLTQTEQYLNSLPITPASLRKARDEVAFDGLKTVIGEDGLTLNDMLKPLLDIARAHLSADNGQHLDPLEKVLETGMSDSDMLKSIENEVNGDYTAFLDLKLTEVKPFIQMYENMELENILNPPLARKEQEVILGAPGKKGGAPS